MSSQNSKLKDESLLIFGKNYVAAHFSHPNSPTAIYAIFRDLTPNNDISDFVMPQNPQGPWNKWVADSTPDDPTDDIMQFDEQYDDIFLETTKRAAVIQKALQLGIIKGHWGGKIIEM